MKKEVFLFLLVALVFIFPIVSALDVDSALVKVSIKEGGSVSDFFSISSEEDESVVLEVVHLEGVALGESSLVIGAGEKKEVGLNFNSEGLSPGVYFGYVSVFSKEDSFKLPIVFEIESSDLFFDGDLEISPFYSKVAPGEEVFTTLKIFDITFGGDSLGPSPIDLKYFLYSLEGVKILSTEESIVVDGDLSLSSSVSLPDDLEEGDYLFGALIVYGNSVGVSSELIEVKKRGRDFFGFFEGNNFSFLLVILMILILFLGMIFFFIYILHDRDRLFLQLRKHNALELKEQNELFREQRRFLKMKKFSKDEVEKEISEKVKKLKEIQNNRVREFKKIKNSKKGSKKASYGEMQRKLKNWKLNGYNTVLLESKLKKVPISEMKKMMAKWEKQGYK